MNGIVIHQQKVWYERKMHLFEVMDTDVQFKTVLEVVADLCTSQFGHGQIGMRGCRMVWRTK